METTRAKVLLIEDDPLHVQIIEGMVLGDHGLFDLVRVDRLLNAIDLLEREKMDLVLLDLTLPDSEGFETVDRIHNRFPNLPIVVLTASSDEAVVTGALRAGAQDFLIKWELNAHLLVRAMRYAIERKRNESALRESEARESEERLRLASSAVRRTEERLTQQATLLDSAQDAIILRDLNDFVIYWNRGAQRLYGWTFEEVKGRKLTELLHREPPPELMKAKHALFSQEQWGGELRQITKGGREVIVQARWTLLRDAGERPKSVLLINTDITEQKRLESMVLRAQRLESIGALASGMAHDLNNVLAPILMALHTLQQRFTDESSQRWLSLIHKSAERGRDLINQVLSFARGAEGERVPLQINRLINDILKILQETLPKNIELQVIVPDGLWMVIGDTTQIHQVLMNLCINARDAMPDGGRLVIKARNRYLVEEEERLVTNPRQKQFARITVADTGVGIPPEIIDRVFDPFFTTKEKGQGTGLGLSTVQGIVRGHGGFVNVISQVGKGTEFKIYLPAQELSLAEEVEEIQQSLPTGHDELIMVVDDEPDIREVTSRTLESNGYRVVLAKDGREAVEIYRRRGNEIDIVLTDMAMPNLDGPGTIRALKQLNPQIVVVATSGVKTTGKLAEATQEGARSFLPKPYTADKLLTVIAEALADGGRNGR